MEFGMPNTNWIWSDSFDQYDQKEPCLVYFRKSFFLEQAPETLFLKISADSRYKLYVNGTLAELGPARGDRLLWYADEKDIAPYLRKGENVLAAEVLRYPLDHQKGNHGIYRTNTPGFYAAEVFPPKECREQKPDAFGEMKASIVPETAGYGISAGPSWKCHKPEGFRIVPESPYFAPLQILEERCGEAETAGWKLPGFDDSSWKNAKAYSIFEISRAVSPGNLLPRPIPGMRKDFRQFRGLFGESARKPDREKWERMLKGVGTVSIPPHTHERAEIDAAELNTGYLSLRMGGGAGAVIKILTSEGYVQKDARKEEGFGPSLPVKKDRCDWEHGYLQGFTDTYHAAGYGTENLPEEYAPFWFRTFRFIGLEIETGEEELTISGFDYLETGYPLEVKSHVETSDDSLEAVWDISLRTLKRCMHETYEDCPFYEQLQYAMDSRSQILYTYAISGDDRLARNCMEDLRRSQRYDGMINCSYPNYGPNVIPGFSIYYILMLYDHMMYFGDKEFLRRHTGAVDGILEYFRRTVDERGLVGKNGGVNMASRYWSFIDWTKQWDNTSGVPTATLYGPITMESFLYIIGLEYGAKVLDYLERPDTADEYRQRAEDVRGAINRYCRGEDGMYTDGPGIMEYSQHCQVFAILTDTVSMEEGRRYLLKTMENKEDYAQCSIAMSYYLFRALEKSGLYRLTDRKWDLWRNMVRDHVTTCVEDDVNSRSDCHAWGSLALYELPSVVLGVRPAAPGYKKIAIRPCMETLDWAKGEVVTGCGIVKVEWKKDEQGIVHLSYEAPEGAEVVLD